MQIQLQTLKAANIAAATKDNRDYLNGVLVEFGAQDNDGNVRANVVGTDGHMLFACTTAIALTDDELAPETGTQIIIPRDVIKAAKQTHKNNPFVTLRKINDTQWQLGDTLFTPIGGKFPDYRRVIPSRESVASAEPKAALFNPDLLTRGADAIRTYRNGKPDSTYSFYQRGDEASAMHDGTNDCVAVIMPIRGTFNEPYAGFTA